MAFGGFDPNRVVDLHFKNRFRIRLIAFDIQIARQYLVLDRFKMLDVRSKATFDQQIERSFCGFELIALIFFGNYVG